jgi:hypothetical protein
MTERREPPWDDETPDMDTEQLLTEWFEQEAPAREPAVLAPNVIARTALTRRRSRWFVRDWWRDLFRLHQRSSLIPALAAGAVAVVAILLVAGLVLPGGLLGEPEDSTGFDIPAQAIGVSPDDETMSQTIGEAIAQAEPGDDIYILPGEYTENLLIDKDVNLIGGGPAEEIVLRPASGDEPIILIDGGNPRIEGFTISGPGNSVVIVASDPTITKMVFDGVGDQWWTYTGAGWDGFDDASPSIRAELFANPTIHENTFIGGGEIDIRGSSNATITDNTLVDGAAIFLDSAGDETVVRGNSITNSGLFSIESTSCAELVIEENTIIQEDPGIAIQALCLSGAILNNTIEGANVGIQLRERANPRIVGNVIDTDGVALEIHEGVEPTLSGNDLCGKNAIMAVMRGGMPVDLSDNTLCEGTPLLFE